MPRRVWFLMVVIAGGVLIAALTQPFVGDYTRYRVLDGFAASHGIWLAVAAALVLALAGMFRPERRVAAVTNLVAGVALAGALAFTVFTTKDRVDPPARDDTCHRGDNPLGAVSCGMHKVLSVLEGKPPPSQPRRWFTELALGAYVVASGAAAMRREA